MATAVLDLELDALRSGISGLADRYRRAFILVRWHRQAVGSIVLPVQDGVISGDALLTAIRQSVGKPLWFRMAHERLGWQPSPSPEPGSARATIAICTRARTLRSWPRWSSPPTRRVSLLWHAGTERCENAGP